MNLTPDDEYGHAVIILMCLSIGHFWFLKAPVCVG